MLWNKSLMLDRPDPLPRLAQRGGYARLLILLGEESPWIDLEKHLNRQHVCIANVSSCFLINHRGERESDITVLFTKRRSIIAPKAHDEGDDELEEMQEPAPFGSREKVYITTTAVFLYVLNTNGISASLCFK